jgi:20S proteasome alpha/beta subunit
MTVEEAHELARRAIYHATFRDGASGGVVSGMFFKLNVLLKSIDPHVFKLNLGLLCWYQYKS